MDRVVCFVATLVFFSGCVLVNAAVRPVMVVRKARNVNAADSEDGPDTPTARGPRITEMLIESEVNVRFASVRMQSEVINEASSDSETTFLVQMPSSAFISKFTMTINGVRHVGQVMEKAEAKEVYDKAKADNETAGHIERDNTRPKLERDMEVFRVSVNIESMSEASFELSYQELIERRLGIYTQRISVQPNQIVPNLTIVCTYYEPQGFIFDPARDIQTPIASNAIDPPSDPDVRTDLMSDDKLRITYKPSVETQASMDPLKGLQGIFRVGYDVKHDSSGGISVYNPNGYAVVYLSPPFTDNDLLVKEIVFVIDISGSMTGLKIVQAREALNIMIEKLRPDDLFNIILFDDKIELWKGNSQKASPNNKLEAIEFSNDNVLARGGTNINAGLLAGVTVFDKSLTTRGNIVFFLTDGEPTVGETNKPKIRANFRHANYKSGNPEELNSVLFALAFGTNADLPFLEKISLENGGFARRIHTESDATEQLTDFYREIESPALRKVDVNFQDSTGNALSVDMSKNEFSYFYSNSEVVVVGKLEPSTDPLVCTVDALGVNGAVEYRPSPLPASSISVDPAFIERLYAYKRIKDLLQRAAISLNENQTALYKEQALSMSLKYQFVTPLTSMVVTRNMEEEQQPPMLESDMSGMFANSGNKRAGVAQGTSYASSACPQLTLLYFVLFLSLWVSRGIVT